MKKASEGDNVKVHYTGTLEDGSVFDSSAEREPLEFTMGAGSMISGFEKAVSGMAVGEKVTVNIPAAEAYGEKRDDLIVRVGRGDFPENIDPQIGVAITMRHPDAGEFDAIVSEVTEDNVILNANHPLAGKALKFDIEVMEIGE
jgi:peptidylprolyl isomerase